jgi:hypothetical protein
MSQQEMTHKRWQTYSTWHRTESIARFTPNPDLAACLCQMDIDASLWVEWRYQDKQPIALIEVACDKGQEKSSTSMTVLLNLARRADIPAYLVFYTPAPTSNPVNCSVEDIASFRVRRLYPSPWPQYQVFTPEQYTLLLLQLREAGARKSWKEFRNPSFDGWLQKDNGSR